jgi:polyphosphate kinase 2 (PPK2 family)
MKHQSLLPLKVQRKVQGVYKDKADYEAQLKVLQKQMLDLQQLVRAQKKKILIVLEGSDAAGKGGVIKRLTEYIDPRGFRVHAIGAPNPVEIKQNYMQRFFQNFPEEGMIVIFDRSWYGRVLVERVEGLASKIDWNRAYGEITAIEEMLAADGVLILKYCLDVSFEEQGKRFKERELNPLKRWKLTNDDRRNRKKWNKYMPAFAEMIERTSSKSAPWTLVAADSKWYARITILADVEKRARKVFLKK